MTTQQPIEHATFALGCFWNPQVTFGQVPGVLKTTVGYTGGHVANPSYEAVCSHTTGHAEAVDIEFDPNQVSYEQLLQVFWDNHNPTTLNQQGPDIGDQYRSAIFTHSEEQNKLAQASKEALAASGKWSKPIVTEIVPATEFYPAEEYHQYYLAKRGMTTCRV
jgi:peptide-methionine (S)-S-oxide reductase